jgi:phenylpropionate dioxygenase-like ring-hydroxylating dioxygenase large terminal subunit
MTGWPVWTGTGYEWAPQVDEFGALSPLSALSTAAALGLVARQVPGYSFERAVHLDPDVYRLEMERIWKSAWLFAAHSTELPQLGARNVFDVGDDSVLIVRDEDAEVRAFHNLCRHRGNRLADRGTRQAGGALLIRCPYHQWVYGLDGSLTSGRWTDYPEGLGPEGFDPSEHGLLPVATSEVGGLIFVRLEPHLDSGLGPLGELANISELAKVFELAGPLESQGFEHANVAHMETYMVDAGWKVIWESYDSGAPRLRALPNFWCEASADHAVITRLAPVRLERTEIVVTWFVDEGAVEGRDYSLDRILALWARTGELDRELCERNQRAVRSPAYRPVPLSERHGTNVLGFHAWYREAMAGGPKP